MSAHAIDLERPLTAAQAVGRLVDQGFATLTPAALAELGWDASGATDAKIGNAITELFERDLIIAGDRYTVRGPGGTGKARSVTQFYTRAHD